MRARGGRPLLGWSLTLLVMGLFPGVLCAQQNNGPDRPVQHTQTQDDAPRQPAATAQTKLEVQQSAPPEHAFWDRKNIQLFSGIAVFRGLDYASTRNFQARGRTEILLPDDVVNNSAGFASLEAAATATSVGLSYLLHRTGHHRLERWLSIGHIAVAGFGVARNYSLKSKHP